MKFELDQRLKPYTLPIGLGAGLLALLLLLLVEWLVFRQGLTEDNHTARAPNPETLGTAVSLDGLGLPGIAEFHETVERPLFMESRRPTPPPPPGPPPRLEPPAPVTFQLMGIIESPKGRLALIAEAKGKYRRLRIKDAIDGWEVTEIRDDRLFLEQGGLKQDIGLVKRRKAATDKSTPPQQQQQPPTAENSAPQQRHNQQQNQQPPQNGESVPQQQPRQYPNDRAIPPEEAREPSEESTEEN